MSNENKLVIEGLVEDFKNTLEELVEEYEQNEKTLEIIFDRAEFVFENLEEA